VIVGYWKHVAVENDGYTDFLQEVIDSGELEPAAVGITKIVIAKGEDALSPKQAYVFKRYVLDEYTTESCDRCGENIPWCEMMQAHETGNCGWCNHMLSKDD
jgi:hypothetical protein